MGKCTIKALVLAIFLGWATQNFAQDYSPIAPKLEFAGKDDIKPVTFRDRILWGGGALLSLPKKRGPIPLYSYPISQLPEDTTLEALSLAAKGNVYIAILTLDDANEEAGTARGLHVHDDWNSISGEEWKKKEWEKFRTRYFTKNDDVYIAFTRPLVIRNIDDLSVDKKKALAMERKKFVTSMGLWSETNN